MGRPKKDPREVKRQIGLFISDEERFRLKKMARTWGLTISQMVCTLINRAYEQQDYLKGYDELSQDDRKDLVYQREHVQNITNNRSDAARRRNLDRRNGLDRGLTNVMVVVAPEVQNLPGVFCRNLGQVWVIPYGILYRVQPTTLIPFPCFASVLDYFTGKRISPSQIAPFINRHRDYVLSSFGEKAVLSRLFAVYGNVNLSIQQSRALAMDEATAKERYEANVQLAREYGDTSDFSSLMNQINVYARQQIDEQISQDEAAGIDADIDS